MRFNFLAFRSFLVIILDFMISSFTFQDVMNKHVMNNKSMYSKMISHLTKCNLCERLSFRYNKPNSKYMGDPESKIHIDK